MLNDDDDGDYPDDLVPVARDVVAGVAALTQAVERNRQETAENRATGDAILRVSQENREERRRFDRVVVALGIWGLVTSGFLVLLSVQGMQSRSRIEACTTAGNPCYDDAQRSTAEAIHQIYLQGTVGVLRIRQCANADLTDFDQCIATALPEVAAAAGITPTPTPKGKP